MTDRLSKLFEDHGQSPWLDNLQRGYLNSGRLAELRDRGVRGLTSNPTIFEKAISSSSDYDDQFAELSGDGGEVLANYWQLVVRDIDGACDVLDPVFRASEGADGFVSVEVAPGLAHDGPGTEEAARHLHTTIARDNLMVKIPGTAEGLAPIEQMIAEGRNINVTLLFGIERYRQVMQAYIAGLEKCAASGADDLSGVASVASFFVSRVDSEIDERLDKIGTPEAIVLKGKAAVAQAKLAYQEFLKAFSGPRWEALTAKNARVQRPLWASTSTKNPDYPDTMYVDSLIGPDTVNTMPDQTIDDFIDHGTLARTVDADLDETRAVWQRLADVGIDIDDVAEVLEREGVEKFAKSFDDLLETLSSKAASVKG